MPPNAHWDAFPHSYTFALPSDSGVLALRVWMPMLASTDSVAIGGLESAPRVGDATYLELQKKVKGMAQQRAALRTLISSCLMIVSGFISLLLFLRERTRSLYFWLAIYLTTIGLSVLRRIVASGDIGFLSDQFYLLFFDFAANVSLWAVLLSLFGMDRERSWRRWTVGLAGVYFAATVVDLITLLFWENGGKTAVWTDALTTAVYSIAPLFIVAILVGGLRRRPQIHLWPLASILVFTGLWVFALQIVGQGVQITHWDHAFERILVWAFRWASTNLVCAILETLSFIALVFTVAREHTSSGGGRRAWRWKCGRRERYSRCWYRKRSTVPGFAIDSVYKPAAELGGDFFQVIALPDTSTLIVIGDVSGKGLKAAMTVSLIVGTLRTLADYTQQPAEILHGLNRRLFGRVQDGFATCVVLRFEANGNATMANAGHLGSLSRWGSCPCAVPCHLGLSPIRSMKTLFSACKRRKRSRFIPMESWKHGMPLVSCSALNECRGWRRRGTLQSRSWMPRVRLARRMTSRCCRSGGWRRRKNQPRRG